MSLSKGVNHLSKVTAFYQIQWQSKDIFIFLEQPCFKILVKMLCANFALGSTSQFQPTEKVIPSEGNGVEVVLAVRPIDWNMVM